MPGYHSLSPFRHCAEARADNSGVEDVVPEETIAESELRLGESGPQGDTVEEHAELEFLVGDDDTPQAVCESPHSVMPGWSQ